MKRRSYLKAMLAAGTGVSAIEAQTAKQNPIVLYVDMQVDPAKEQEMVKNFHTVFKPAGMKFPGYIDLKIVKLRSVLQGVGAGGHELSVPAYLRERRGSAEVD